MKTWADIKQEIEDIGVEDDTIIRKIDITGKDSSTYDFEVRPDESIVIYEE